MDMMTDELVSTLIQSFSPTFWQRERRMSKSQN